MGTIRKPSLLQNQGYLVYFDNVRVDQFVKDYSVTLGLNGTIGTATINMIYVPDFDKVKRDSSKIQQIKDQTQKAKAEAAPVATTKKVQKAKVVNCYHLTVRKGPSMSHGPLAWVDAGDELDYLGRGGNNNYWVKVKVSNGTGWVGGKYVKIIDKTVTVPGTTKSTSKTSGDGGRPGVVHNCYALVVRSSPNYGKNEIGWIHPEFRKFGDHNVTAYETKDGWIKVKWWDRPRKQWRMGWTGPRYIKITGPATSKKASDDFTVSDGLDLSIDDGIENMTNVRIFVRNMYSENSDKYVQIFEGNITSKSITCSGNEWSLSFQCQDYMNWFSRTICAVAVPFDNTLTPGDRLRWKAQGIDLDKVQKFNSVKDITFKGKTISQTWQILSDQTIKSNKLFSDSSTVANFDASLERVVVMGDIDEKLRKAEVMDFLISSSVTQVNSVYVLLNDVLKTLMFEFYQDREGTVRIKPPFWNEHVLSNFVIYPGQLLSYTESSNFNQMYTRVIASGALDEWHENDDTTSNSELVKSLINPVVAVTSGGVSADSGPVVVTSKAPTSGGNTSGSSGSIANKAVSIAQQYIGWPYVWGGARPSQGGFDCSGIIDYAYKQAGYQGFGSRETTFTLVNRGTAVNSKNDVLPGDIILPHAEHVYMVVDSSRVLHAPSTGKNIEYKSLSSVKAWKIRRLVHGSTSSGSTTTSNNPTPVKPESVGPDILLKPTYLEKKYGPLVYECSQPLIKFSTSGATNSKDSYDALTKYARFMINYLNSSVSMATLHVSSMPWLRPGFNIWVDPVNIDKIYYINTIQHYGNGAGNFTNLTLSFGRRRTVFCNEKSKLGSLKPGQSDDIFVNKLMVTPSHFGKVCDYNNLKKKFDEHFSSGDGRSDNMFLTHRNSFLTSLYKDVAPGTQYSNEVKAATGSTKKTGTVNVNSALNVRSGPGTNHSIKGVLYKGNSVTIIKEQGGWLNIEYKGGNAWVSSQYVIKNSTSTASGKTGTVKVNTALNVRSGPGTNYSIKGSLYNGNTVTIHSEKNGWLNIDYKGGKAWVSGTYVTRSTSAPSNKVPNSSYASHTAKAYFPAQYTIKDIQTKLNSVYNGANTVVKDRSKRLASLVNHSTKIMQNGMYMGDFIDNPISTSKGGR